MKLRLSISPCPNDTFMFEAMLNGRVDTEGLEFDVSFADIEELNRALSDAGPGSAAENMRAAEVASAPHISKASYAVYPQVADKYLILDSGSALGKGNGPLVVSAREGVGMADPDTRIAVPGMHTTANLLLERLFPHLTNKREYLFSEVADAVARGECDAGVLIHEGRFVYRRQGLHMLCDLGLEWERRMGLPLPLGAILISRELPSEIRSKVGRVLRRSIEHAMAHPADSADFVRSHAQEMDPEVIGSHIALFVNGYSLTLGEYGRRAVKELLNIDCGDSFG